MLFHQTTKQWIIWKIYGRLKSLTNELVYTNLKNKIDTLGKMLNKFLQAVEKDHQSPK